MEEHWSYDPRDVGSIPAYSSFSFHQLIFEDSLNSQIDWLIILEN